MKYYPLADDRWAQGPKFAEVLDGLEVGAGRLGVSLKGSKGPKGPKGPKSKICLPFHGFWGTVPWLLL